MSKKIAYFLAFCVVSMGFVIFTPSAGAQQNAINVRTHHREDSWPTYSYPPDDFFRDEFDFDTIPNEYDNVYYSFFASDGGVDYIGFLWVEILDPSDFQVYWEQVELVDADDGNYQSWDDWYYWDVPDSPAIGEYTLNIWNTTNTIGSHTFWVYEPTAWSATIETFEDWSYTIAATQYPINSDVFYSIHVEDEHGGPLYRDLEVEWAWSFVEHNGFDTQLDNFDFDYEGNDYGNFDLDNYWNSNDQLGSYILKIQYPYGTDIPTTTSFTVYEPVYTATIKTWLGGFTTETSIYPMNGRVYWTAHIADQHGRNISENTDLYVQIEHDPGEWGYWDWNSVDDYGNASDSFWLSSTRWDDEEQIGLFTLRLSDSKSGDPFSGSAEFEVIGIRITPDKPIYAQGEEITITITTEIYQSNINITIYDEDGSVIEDWNDQSMANKIWTGTYPLSLTLPDGRYYLRVNESDTDRLLVEIEFNVKKYTLRIWPDAGAYLPGEIMTLYYTVTSNKDGSGVSGTTIKWIFEYYDTEKGDWDSFTDSLINAGASGNFPIVIPELASRSRDAKLYVWANDTSGHSDYHFENINIGEVAASLSLRDDEYIPGDFVVVTVSANIDGSPLRNGNVNLNVSKEGVEIAAYTVDNLKTDSRGYLTYIFTLQGNAEVGLYTVAINVSKENDWDTDKEGFEIVENRKMSLKLGFDSKFHSDNDNPLYYSDDTVTVTYTALRGEEIVENVNCEYWVYYGDNYISAGTTSTGEFTFDIPEDFEGLLRLYVQVTDSEGNKASRPAYIDVDGPGLILKPNINEYLPGDTIKIEYSVVGTDLPDVSYYYQIEDDNHPPIIVKRGDLTQPSGEFQFKVPEADVPDSYTIRGWITDNIGNSIAQSFVVVTRLRGYMITFSLDKRTYRPGETATLHYKITSVDDSEIPQDFTLAYGFLGGPQRSTQVSKTEGDLKLKVPEDAADGSGFFYIQSFDLPYGKSSYANAQQEANIRANPNPLAETIGDMPLLSLILLVLVLIALIFGIGGWRRGKKALEEAKLPPWKKEGPLPEPEKFKEPGEPLGEEKMPLSKEEEAPSPPEDKGPEPPEDMPPQ